MTSDAAGVGGAVEPDSAVVEEAALLVLLVKLEVASRSELGIEGVEASDSVEVATGALAEGE